MPVAERRAPVLACFERLYGPRAAESFEYTEQTWAEEEWSGGGPTSNFGAGGWIACGSALCEPAGQRAGRQRSRDNLVRAWRVLEAGDAGRGRGVAG